MVEFVDGSVKAQISNPDMRIPIQYALLHPERVENNTVKKFDPLETSNLTFSTYDPSRYPCFQLALEIGMRGATWPAVLCGADEAAVELFLSGQIGFLEIEDVIRVVTNRHKPKQQPTATDILYAASWASEQAFDIFRK
jgi:1-deoxy-D-xylulose-5-phosphate reductoisomerase